MKRKLEAPLIDLSSEVDRKENQQLPSSVLKNVENMELLSSQLSPTKNAGAPVREKKKKKKTQKQIDKELENERKAKEAERKSKAQLKLSSFFKKVDKPKPVEPENTGFNPYFRPFTVKPNTTLAPQNRFFRTVDEALFFSQIDIDADISSVIASFKSHPPFLKPTSITPSRYTHKFKFLKFAEDVRPAYYGTFFKTSTLVTPHKPFGTDPQLDYDFDSEAEWDDDPGEDLVSEEEVDDTVPNDDDDPTKSSWLVPHGYLSDDEGVEHDLKMEELKVKVVTVLVPVLINPGGMSCMPELMVVKFDESIVDPFEIQASTYQEYRAPGDGRATAKKSSIFPADLIPELEESIRNCLPEHTLGILINNFWIDHQELTKTAIETEFKKLARRAKSSEGITKYMLRVDIEQLKSRQSLREGGSSVDYFESDEEDETEFLKKIGGPEAIIVPIKESSNFGSVDRASVPMDVSASETVEVLDSVISPHAQNGNNAVDYDVMEINAPTVGPSDPTVVKVVEIGATDSTTEEKKVEQVMEVESVLAKNVGSDEDEVMLISPPAITFVGDVTIQQPSVLNDVPIAIDQPISFVLEKGLDSDQPPTMISNELFSDQPPFIFNHDSNMESNTGIKSMMDTEVEIKGND